MKALFEYMFFPKYIKKVLPFHIYWLLEHYRFLEKFWEKRGYNDYALKYQIKIKTLLDKYEVEYNTHNEDK